MQGSHAGRARHAARLSLAGAVLCLLAATATYLPVPRASAAPSGSLVMNPNNSSINVNDTLPITFDVVGGSNIKRVLLTVTYNPVVVSVDDADANAGGVQIMSGAYPGTTLTGNVLQNDATNGTIVYEYVLSGSSDPNPGNGTVATAQFRALAPGNANLQFTTVEFTDDSQVNSTPGTTAATLFVGQAVPTNTPTNTGTATATGTPVPTDTPAPTNTPDPAGTDTATPTATETTTPGTATPTLTPTPAASSTPAGTNTPAATATPRITVVDDSNKAKPPQSSVDPAQAGRANGLPSAGNEGPAIQWWRWVFFLAAVMLGIAGWFFTFAIHYGDKEPVLVDRFDRRRRRR